MKKIIWPGIIVGIATLILGMVISYLFMLIPTVNADYYNPAIMRQWTDPLMTFFFLYPFIYGIILAAAWNKSKSLFKDKRNGCRGRKFGLWVFLIATVPGMFITYVSMPYALLTVISWTVQGFVSALIAGTILAAMNR